MDALTLTSTTPAAFDLLLPMALALLAALLAVHGTPRVAAALRQREEDHAPLLLVRGGRSLIAAAALLVIAGGIVGSSQALVWFGIAFLAEELYETGLVILILRRAERQPA